MIRGVGVSFILGLSVGRVGKRESRRRCVLAVVNRVDWVNSIRIIVDKSVIPWWTRSLASSMILSVVWSAGHMEERES